MIDRLYAAVAAALQKDAVRTALARQGLPIELRTPAEMSTMLPGEVAKWAAVIRSAHMAQE